MFRGGGTVDSYGTGITAPLVPGYMGGGQIGGGIIYGKPMADGRFGFQAPVMFNAAEMTMPASGSVVSGLELLAKNKALRDGNVPMIPVNVPGVVDQKQSETEVNQEGDTKLIADQKDFIQKFTENDQIGRTETSDGLDYLDFTNKELGVDENTILPGEEIIEIDGVKVQKKNTKLVPVNPR
jgi:hypothetical protein